MNKYISAGRMAVMVAHVFLIGLVAGQESPVIRVTSREVQVDAVVVDGAGRAVTDLAVGDFEIRQDGKAQRVGSARWIGWGGAARGEGARPARTVGIAVDDLGLSGENMIRLREALRKWVREGRRAEDRVGIVPTGRSLGVLSQFTTDQKLLQAAIERLRYNPNSRLGGVSMPGIGAWSDARFLRVTAGGQFGAIANPEPTRQRLFMDGTLTAVEDMIRTMGRYPGRKDLVLVSESAFVNIENHQQFQRLADLANRNFVVLHAVDPRGVVNPLANASDAVGLNGGRANTNARRVQASFSQNGMDHLARETGGSFSAGSNELAALVGQAVEGVGGYYLLSYTPPEETFGAKQANKWHRLEVSVKRPGLAVRSRGGFLGTPDPPVAAQTPALDTIRVRLTGYHVEDAKEGSVAAALMHIDARDLELREGKGSVELTAMVVSAEGKVESQKSEAFDLTLKPEAVEEVRRQGLVYTLYQPVKRAGGFQMRVGVRDRVSERKGTASQYVEIPEVRGGALTLSSMVVQTPEGGASMAVRQFAPKSSLVWGARILNAKRGKGDLPQLSYELVIYRDGQQVMKTPAQAWTVEKTDDAARLPIGGRLDFGGGMGPGDYVLELVVHDALQKDAKHAVATQAIDFEVKAP